MENTRKIFAIFPGQGSQKVGMGAHLCESSEVAKSFFDMANKVLGFSLSKICFQGPQEKLTETQIAQPAILTMSVVCFEIFQQHTEASAIFDVLSGAGHSLGEYSALVASASLDFKDVVLLVHKRGCYMQEAVPFGEGKMVAVLGMQLPELEQIIDAHGNQEVQIANVNAPGQVVLSGRKNAVDSLIPKLGKAKAIELPVSAPFHCMLMKPAEESLAKDIQSLSISPAKFPIYSNYSAKPVTEPEQIKSALIKQVCGRVRWVECVENAILDTSPELVMEFGYGNVLTNLLKKIKPEIPRANIDSLDKIRELMEA